MSNLAARTLASRKSWISSIKYGFHTCRSLLFSLTCICIEFLVIVYLETYLGISLPQIPWEKALMLLETYLSIGNVF
jgi:hypothetical protein